MLDVLKVFILGLVEGITEWLPVSSTGHLILVGDLLKPGLSDAFMEMFNVVIQLGAIMAVVVLYFHKLNPFSPTKTNKQKMLTWQMWIKVVIASVPAALIELGLLLFGCLVSFVVSVFAIKFLMSYIKKHDFKVFGYYRIILGGLIVLITLIQMVFV